MTIQDQLNEVQDQLNEALVNKLEELTAQHNALVMATQAMLAQINELALKVQVLEQERRPQVPEDIQAEDL